MIKSLVYICVCCFLTGIVQASNSGSTLTGLLNKVHQFTTADSVLNQQREQMFDADLQRQQLLLENSRKRLQAAEAEQQHLKETFDANDLRLGDMEALIQQRSGQLGEVFGVAKEEATKLRSLLDDSMVSADNPERSQQLEFADSRRVPTLKDLNMLWYQAQLEMTESGKISRFNAHVISADGTKAMLPVVRFGLFSVATEQGNYLNWDVQQQILTELPTQPENTSMQLTAYLNGKSEEVKLDPTRGQLFALLDRKPSLLERIHQGGEVGYVILALGVLGLLIALMQMLIMLFTEVKVNAQLRQGADFRQSNALGRVLQAASDKMLTPEQRELKVDEAILQELPGIERGQSLVKLLATVAPLLGLLGTVVGMIATFQSITLFGTSDPKLMASGISQALITTVQGLVVAIPLLFSYSFLTSRSRRLTQILQEKSLGLLAELQVNHDVEEFEHVA